MPITEQIIDGLQLALLGMAVVFVFLSILILVMLLMSRLASKFAQVESPTAATFTVPLRNSGVDANVVPVIAAAIAVLRRRRSS